jgi:5'-nucleotidase (lipoprotein e(P4) family)
MRLSTAALALLFLGCASSPPAQPCNLGHTLVNGALWTQSSAESRASALQTYAAARRALDAALAAPAESSLPPAIILDLDETAFDNTRYAAQQIRQGHAFTFGTDWDVWVAQSAATAVPGAQDFLTYAHTRGVTPFYITNRTTTHEAATRVNLRKLGFPLSTAEDTVLVRNERPDWNTYDKTTRRDSVAARYRVLLYLGDALGDFPSGDDTWGTRSFIISNPIYGSWENGGTGTDCEQLQNKMNALRP